MAQSTHSAEDTALVRARASIGDFELTVCTDGTYLLDGGAMFGVVPKTLWQKRIAPNADNQILMGLNSVVVRAGKNTVVIETGIGNKQPPKMREIFQNQELLLQSYAAAGVDPDQVDVVVNTHLHFDHCGWNTTLHPDGSVTPTFKNARYFAHAGEVAHGHLQLERDRVSYLSPNYDPLVESGQMTLLDAGSFAAGGAGAEATVELCPGISVELFPGHTAQMMGVHIQPPRAVESRAASSSASPHACYIGDLIPTAHHLDVTWVMGYDLDPLRCIEERKRFYARAIPEEWLVLFPHDHDTPMARVAMNEKGKPVVKG
jgi:glyoxylase-like metal-dependent hydrolase (beta-lactamase superfamily II)